MSLKHGGNIRRYAEIANCDPNDILDFSANINPLGFPDWFRPLMLSEMSALMHYPDPEYKNLKKKVAARNHIQENQIVFGNGASELLYALPRSLGSRKSFLPLPAYNGYTKALKASGVEITAFQLLENEDFSINFERLTQSVRDEDLIIFGNPSNPTGSLVPFEKILKLAEELSKVNIIVDESFMDFTDGGNSLLNKKIPTNLIIVASLTKAWALPGLRLGMAIMDQQKAKALEATLPTWSMNHLAAVAFERAMEDETFLTETHQNILSWKKELKEGLSRLGMKVFPSEANYLLVKHDGSGSKLRQRLLQEHRIALRGFEESSELGPEFSRLAVRNQEENERLLLALHVLMERPRFTSSRPKKVPALMLQGTGSNVGKSIMSTALCRIFLQDGLRVAPFKSQNMALNSFVTPGGHEIGRAQALQAQAAKLIPDVRMNPVLLKPSSEKGSQVIVNGKPVAHMDFRDYTKYKPEAFLEVKRSYDSLASENQLMILEGAGGASEVNLKSTDIVNMKMARHAEAKVLIVGNIDYGGIFGSMVGTMETMAEWERNLVAGFVINRFRGIKELLQGGVDYLENVTKKKVVGIVPHFKHSLPEEDSLEFKSGVLSDLSPLGDRIDIALIDTPRLSNHTDLDALSQEPDVRVRHVKTTVELGRPDIIILGGSKNVTSDLTYLRENGLAQAILELTRSSQTELVGICGGYQMLGEKILDPDHVESDLSSVDGLGLLPLHTVFHQEKILKQSQLHHRTTGLNLNGYEIHHGRSHTTGPCEVLLTCEEAELGHGSLSTKTWGSYLHGIFDHDEFRRWFIDRARVRKGLAPVGKILYRHEVESQIDELASHVRASLDMDHIYRILGL